MALIEMTEAAAQRVRSLLEGEGQLETHVLRIKVIGGGCSGLQYQLSFDDARSDSDHDFEFGGARLRVDEKSALYLAGCTVDFIDTLQESGFKIANPSASNTCGCGQSFAA